MSAATITYPRAKFQFESKEGCELALKSIGCSHPNLMANIVPASNASKFYLFVPGGTFVKMVK